ncbi:hypothetical protein WJX84_008058 [Apatococcus fuscideae]|uniref:N-acetyltransferase domain-containing protein n=1 Tax=Apatococcus fuscideae TaxID=2026836 RepID=A0AAW1TDQ9_9CHLO
MAVMYAFCDQKTAPSGQAVPKLGTAWQGPAQVFCLPAHTALPAPPHPGSRTADRVARQESSVLHVMGSPQQPYLQTYRLLLRPLITADAQILKALAGDRRIADTTASIPHPYQDEDATWYIQHSRDQFALDASAIFAVAHPEHGLVGIVSLSRPTGSLQAELGYWIGVPFWGNGFATEAAKRLLSYGFETMGLQTVQGRLFVRNAASSVVMSRLGMKKQRVVHRATEKWGTGEDEEIWQTSLCEAT